MIEKRLLSLDYRRTDARRVALASRQCFAWVALSSRQCLDRAPFTQTSSLFFDASFASQSAPPQIDSLPRRAADR